MKLRNETSVLDLFFLFKIKRLNIHWGGMVEENTSAVIFKELKCLFSPPKVFIFTKMVARKPGNLNEYF